MPSVSDIPGSFLDPVEPDRFLAWLDGLSIPYDVKKSTMQLFTDLTGHHFLAAEYFRIVDSHY